MAVKTVLDKALGLAKLPSQYTADDFGPLDNGGLFLLLQDVLCVDCLFE